MHELLFQGPNDSGTSCGPWDSSLMAPGDSQWIVDGPRMPGLLSQGPQMTLELVALGKEWYGYYGMV